MRTPTCAALAITLAIVPVHAQPTPSPAPVEKSASKQLKTADEAWAQIEKLEKGPEEAPGGQADSLAFLKQLQSALSDFATRFPQDPRHFGAKLENAEIENTLAELTQKPSNPKAVDEICTEIIAAKNVPDETRRAARFLLLRSALEKGADEKLQGEVAAFCKDYPNAQMAGMLNLMLAKQLEKSDPAKANSLLGELAKSKDEDIAAAANTEIRLEAFKNKPLDIKFTALDGTEVDLSKLRGKVVLVDFWATWCGPCMGEVPHVVEAYKKFHGKGFEVVGISLDQKKESVIEVTKEKGMSWPQYFDGKGWENAISSKFGIDSIPAMWLVNKKGILVDTDCEGDLEASIEKLLGE